MWSTLLLLLPLLALPSAHSLTLPKRADKPLNVTATARARIQDIYTRYNVPGAIIGVVSGNYSEVLTFGVQDNRNTPFQPDTYVAIASNSKLITSLAVGLLINDGVKLPNGQNLTYQTRLKDVIPYIEYADANITETVTLFNVLSMRTGIPGHVLSIRASGTVEDYVRRLKYLSPTASPGELLQYSNTGYIALSAIFPILVNKTVEDFVQERIFTPLNMSATYSALDAKERGNLSYGFFRQDINVTACAVQVAAGGNATDKICLGSNEAVTFWTDGSGGEWSGSGSAILTGQDLVTWTKELVNPKIIPASVIEYTESAIPLPSNASNSSAVTPGTYQLGVVEQNYRGYVNTLHDGALPGSNSYFTRVKSEQVGVFVVSNDDYLSPLHNQVVASILLDDLLGLKPLDWERKVLEELGGGESISDSGSTGSTAATPATPPTIPRAEPSSYAGRTFNNGAYGNFTLSSLQVTNKTSFEASGLPRDFILTDISTSTGLDFSQNAYYGKSLVNNSIANYFLFSHWDGPLYNVTVLYVKDRAKGEIEIQQVPEWGSQFIGKIYGAFPAVFAEGGIGIFGDFANQASSLPVRRAVETGVKEQAVAFFDRR